MREGWTYQNFEKCIEKVKYTTKIASSDFHLGSKYPIISQEEDYISGYWDKEEDVFHITKPVVIFGDHTRVLKYVDMDFVLGADGVKILQPIDNLNAKFLKYYLQAYQIPNLGYSRHYKILKDINVPIPPLTTQQQIVSELDLLSHILDQKRQQLKEYDALAESIFYDMFGDPVENPKGWEKKKLGDICSQIKDGVHAKPQYVDFGVPFVSVININKGVLNLSDCKYVSQEAYAKMSKSFKAEKGDILYSKVGATYGIPALVDTDQEFGLYVSVSLLKPKREIVLPLFLKISMGLRYIKDQADKGIKGIGVPDLHLSVIKEFQVLLPPLTLQRSFASKIRSIEHQKQLLRASIKETEMLFQSRMDYWFNG